MVWLNIIKVLEAHVLLRIYTSPQPYFNQGLFHLNGVRMQTLISAASSEHTVYNIYIQYIAIRPPTTEREIASCSIEPNLYEKQLDM